MSIYTEWLEAKEAERLATEKRRGLEDLIVSQFGIKEDFEGTSSKEIDGLEIKITGRMNRKIDTDVLQEIAAEHGTSSMLSDLFRWRAEINMSAWKNTSKEITAPLMAAITTTPGRPSFAIKPKE